MGDSKEQGKKKILDKDLSTVSGGCGSKKPKPKYRVGQRILVRLGKGTAHYGEEVEGTIIQIVETESPKVHCDYLTKCDLEDYSMSYYLCLEDVPGCIYEHEMIGFKLL